MNLAAGMILLDFVERDGAPAVRARVLVEGHVVAEFGAPLDPGLLDVRDDVRDVATRAADTFVALVRNVAPYPLAEPKPVTVQISNVAARDPDRFIDGLIDTARDRLGR